MNRGKELIKSLKGHIEQIFNMEKGKTNNEIHKSKK